MEENKVEKIQKKLLSHSNDNISLTKHWVLLQHTIINALSRCIETLSL